MFSISPHPSPLPWGEGTLDGGFAPILRVRGNVVAVGIGEAVLDEVFCCFHSMADFDAGCFALHCVDKELCDGVSILGEADNVLL